MNMAAILMETKRHPVLELLDKAIRASYVEGCIKDERSKWDRYEAVDALEKAVEELIKPRPKDCGHPCRECVDQMKKVINERKDDEQN